MHRLYGENADRLGQSFSTPKVTLNVGYNEYIKQNSS